MGLAMLAAGAENPKLLKPLAERLAEARQEIAATSDDPLGAYVVWLARDMMMMWSVLGISPFDEAQSRDLHERLASLAEAGGAGI